MNRQIRPHPSPPPKEREQEVLAPFSLGRRVGDEGCPDSRRRSMLIQSLSAHSPLSLCSENPSYSHVSSIGYSPGRRLTGGCLQPRSRLLFSAV
ncbi:MAG: hypothetical protein LH660_14940 [Phormidesmis sp. CAN_BIN36]|nr:hypothetical protein [Phormidesmis sp. CAN_BIN36]